jgi:hypothetical protein
VLTALVASVAPSSLPGPKAYSDPAGLKRSPVPLADPTLRAKERPDMPEDVGKPTVETARAVSHERSLSPPRRRASLLVVAVLALAAASAAIGAVVVQRRGGTTEASSATTGVAPVAPSTTIAPTIVVPSVVSPVDQPASSAPASGSIPPPQTAASAAVRSDIARPVRPRSEAKRDADAPLAPSAPPAALESPAPNCNPPFYYDSNSNRVFKKECLQH